MKTRFLAVLAVFAVFAIAAYAFTQDSLPAPQKTSPMSSSCCKKGDKDSCPMKGKDTPCCKKHGGEQAKHDCSECDCCGDSCPMKNGAGATQSGEGKSCPDDCPCGKTKANTGA